MRIMLICSLLSTVNAFLFALSTPYGGEYIVAQSAYGLYGHALSAILWWVAFVLGRRTSVEDQVCMLLTMVYVHYLLVSNIVYVINFPWK